MSSAEFAELDGILARIRVHHFFESKSGTDRTGRCLSPHARRRAYRSLVRDREGRREANRPDAAHIPRIRNYEGVRPSCNVRKRAAFSSEYSRLLATHGFEAEP